MALIEKEALLAFERLDAQIERHTANDILMMIKTAPHIDPVHAEGGCRCVECRWGQKDDAGMMHCHTFHIHKKPDWFCSDGELREAKDDG